jgi:hypothetical protein
MVHVPMRDPDLLKRQPLLLEAGQQPRRFPARIDDRRLLRRGAPDDGAVLLAAA